METILFVFKSKESLQKSENLLRDIWYESYGFKIESRLEQDFNLAELNKSHEYLLVFTEVETLMPSSTFCRRLEGLGAKDLIGEIYESLV